MNINELKSKYLNKKFTLIGNTERKVEIVDVDELFMTVKVTYNKYSRQNCVGDYFPYEDDVIKYPLTNLPVLFEMKED